MHTSTSVYTYVYINYHTLLGNRARTKAVKYPLNSRIADHNIVSNSTSSISETCVVILMDISVLTIRVGRVMQILSVKPWTCQGQLTVDLNESRISPCSLGLGFFF